jgi:hypothetical protein
VLRVKEEMAVGRLDPGERAGREGPLDEIYEGIVGPADVGCSEAVRCGADDELVARVLG